MIPSIARGAMLHRTRAVARRRCRQVWFATIACSGWLLACGVLASDATAQAVAGRVLDAASGEAIAGALVQLIAADSSILLSAVTDEDGAFRLAPSGGNVQFVRASRVGYHPLRAPLVELVRESTPLVIRLEPAPVALASLSVESERQDRYLRSVGFYDRQRLGFGYVITREMIETRFTTARSAGEILSTLPGLLMEQRNDGDNLIFMKRSALRLTGPCPARVYLNGLFIGESLPHLFPEDIAGIEVFRGAADVPPRFGGAYAACGVILIWLRTRQSSH